MNAHKWADLKELSDDELIAEHDAVAEHTAVGTQHYLDELRYRQQACVAEATGQFRWHQRALPVADREGPTHRLGPYLVSTLNERL